MPSGVYIRTKETTKETREKMSLSHTGIKVGKRKSAVFTELHKLNLSKSHKKRWEGKVKKGKTYLHQNNNREYRAWRSMVFERDDWTCQTCKVRGVYLEAHHIKSWTMYPELRYELSNGLTLCKNCHRLTRKK